MRPPRPTTSPRRLALLALTIAAALIVGCTTGDAPEQDGAAVDEGEDADGEDDGVPDGNTDDGPPHGDEVATEARTVLDGLLHIEVPTDWEVAQDTSAVYVVAAGGDDVSSVLSAAVVPSEGLDDLDSALEDALGGSDAATSPTVLPGAEEAYRFERETSGGLWQRGAIARTNDGQVVLVLLAADAADAPSDDLTDHILGSVTLRGDAAPQAMRPT